MNKDDIFALGADIGGTHITAALVNVNSKELILPTLARTTVPADSNVDALIAGWSDCIAKAKGNRQIAKICIAMPGPFMYKEGICLIKDQGKYPGLYGVNIKERLSQSLKMHETDIFLYNDAACFLQGEVFSGNLEGMQQVIGVTLGTGLGTATYHNKIAVSADLWKMPFLDSIAEDYFSSRWFINRYKQLTGQSVDGVKELVSLSAHDPSVTNIFNEFGTRLGEFFSKFIELENPEAVVIGGNISKAYPMFREAMLRQVHSVYPFMKVFQVSKAEQSALLGAVSSWYFSRQLLPSDNEN